MKKGMLLHYLWFLVLVTVLVGFFVYTNNKPKVEPVKQTVQSSAQDETSSWKTYSSQSLKISFKYPSDYEIQSDQKDLASIISPLNPNHGKGYELQDGELKVEIALRPSTPNETLEQYVEDAKKQGFAKVESQSKTIIDNLNAIHVKYKNNAEVFYLLVNNKRITLAKFPLKTSRQPEFDKILSTFKFAQ